MHQNDCWITATTCDMKRCWIFVRCVDIAQLDRASAAHAAAAVRLPTCADVPCADHRWTWNR